MKLLNSSSPKRSPGRLPPQYSIAGGCWRSLLQLGLLIFGATSCRQPPAATAVPLTAVAPNPTPLTESLAATQAQLRRWTPPPAAIPITLHRLDDQCQDYVAETALVDPEQPITDAIRHVLLRQEMVAFDLSGYRVSLSADRTLATIDFRLDPDSQRQLVSLADCEQKALFGSLRQTLTQGVWNIQQVQFTNRGEPLLL